MQWLKRSRRSLPGVVMMFWFLTWMQVTCERRFMLWTVWLNFVYTLSCPFSSMTRQKNQSWCVSFANSFSIILAASHCESLALAPSTHDSLSLWRHSLWKRRVWARNQVFFFFLEQYSTSAISGEVPADVWMWLFLGLLNHRAGVFQTSFYARLRSFHYYWHLHLCFLSFFLFSFKENSTLSMYNWHTQSV